MTRNRPNLIISDLMGCASKLLHFIWRITGIPLISTNGFSLGSSVALPVLARRQRKGVELNPKLVNRMVILGFPATKKVIWPILQANTLFLCLFARKWIKPLLKRPMSKSNNLSFETGEKHIKSPCLFWSFPLSTNRRGNKIISWSVMYHTWVQWCIVQFNCGTKGLPGWSILFSAKWSCTFRKKDKRE